jgi:hypothetical protein
MTKLAPGKTVVRETGEFVHASPYVVELHHKHLVLRVKGSQDRVEATYSELRRFLAFRAGAAVRSRKAAGR